GSFDSDALQVADIPFSNVSEMGGTVHWSLKGDQSTTTFEGTLARDTLVGTFNDGKDKGTFALARAALPAAGIQSRDITFTDKNVTLAGTLLVPPGAGRHPAILFLQGSGPEGRWANRYLAEKFAESG